MALKMHGLGDRMDQHNSDPNAHGGSFLAAADASGPSLLVPPGALLAASAAGAWYTANAATFLRFSVPIKKAYRYINLYVGTASGNIQAGIVSMAPSSATAMNATKIADTGVIACPASGNTQLDLGSKTLAPGDYALFLWCDNTTATFLHGLATGLTASRMLFTATGLTSGVGASVLTVSTTTRWVSGLTLETA